MLSRLRARRSRKVWDHFRGLVEGGCVARAISHGEVLVLRGGTLWHLLSGTMIRQVGGAWIRMR